MSTAAVMIDKWKLGIFEKHLKGAGFAYKQLDGVTVDTFMLKVEYGFGYLAKLQQVIVAAQTECGTTGAPK